MTDRSYLSIGDVLALLRDEFPDITISKIRFLESRGLLDPERTPSGYRKFYEPDVERLRWILRQQREHFLPLKVIKGRLEGGKESDDDLPVTQSLFDPACGDSPAADDEPLLVGALANGGERAEPVSRVSAIDMAAPSEEEPLVVTPVRSEVGAGPHPAPPGTFFGGVTGARSRQGPATAGDLPLTSPAVGSPASRGPEPGFGALPGSAAGSSAGASS
ncbi:MAG TPA: MerR family transcriptional regulator, partial [Acidimicrobiales bacterium]|nr:MerR family transcriptional regulator [Acidimicrobiales bacterium]